MSNLPNLVNPSKVNLEVPAQNNKVDKKTFYARVDGITYVTKKGKVLRFKGGEYDTNVQEEIEELEDLCKQEGQFLICDHKVDCRKSDAKILQEVGGTTKTGIVSTMDIAGMARG